MPVCFLPTLRNIHLFGNNVKKQCCAHHTQRGSPQAGRDEGCWCRNKSFHSSWMLPHRIWALSHMWAAPSSLRRSLPVLDRNICEDPWPSQDSSSSIIFVGHTLCRRDLQRVYLPPSHHTGRSSFKEGSRAQEGWPVASREVQLWL